MTYLDQTTVVAGNKQLAIITNEATSRDIFEPCDGLDNFLCPRCVYMHPCSSGDRIFVWLSSGEMNRGNGSVFFDKYGAFKRPPIARFYAMLFWSRFWVFSKNERLVIHVKRSTMMM
jgi:hypothetical protein